MLWCSTVQMAPSGMFTTAYANNSWGPFLDSSSRHAPFTAPRHAKLLVAGSHKPRRLTVRPNSSDR